MEISNLIEVLPERYTPADQELLERAYRFAAKAHKGQKRVSGEPYVNHCLAVAIILAELHVPPVVVAAGLLHDTIEDTSIKLGELRAEFGDEVTEFGNLGTYQIDGQCRVIVAGVRYGCKKKGKKEK